MNHSLSRLRIPLLAATLLGGCVTAPPTPAEPAYPTPPARIAFGSCVLQGAPQPVWEGIAASRPDALILAGDNIYADTEDMDLMRAMYRELGKQPGYQALKRTGPIFATWDDHDYGVNDGGAEYPKKEESKNCFLEFFQFSEDHPVRARPGIYHQQRIELAGLDIQIILLDTRSFRGPLPRHDSSYPDRGPYATHMDTPSPLLGEAQWRWLETTLREPADLRILVSSIQLVAEDHHWESWSTLPAERDRLFALLRSTRAGGVLVISGDRHHGELSAMDAGIGYRLYDLTASGLNRGWKRPKQEVNRHRVGPLFLQDHFGLIEIDPSAPETVIRLQLRDDQGTPVLNHEFPLRDLCP